MSCELGCCGRHGCDAVLSDGLVEGVSALQCGWRRDMDGSTWAAV